MTLFYSYLACTVCSFFIHAKLDETSGYFNTSFLIHYDKVSERLKQDGFQQVYFHSDDNLTLSGLWLERENALGTAILCAGFYPGRKEGLAAFYHLLPQCNLLLFDARGHGESEGRFWSNIFYYGRDEYKDILGALEFVKSTNNKPIFLLGMCAGAFHCIKAIQEIQKNNLTSLLPAGLILDSSILVLEEAIDVPKRYFIENTLPNLLRKYLYPECAKQVIKDSITYKLSSLLIGPLLAIPEYIFFPFYRFRNDALNVKPLISKLNIPLFFIHTENDNLAPFKHVAEYHRAGHTCWFEKKAGHACIYLQYKHKYKKNLFSFMTNILKKIH